MKIEKISETQIKFHLSKLDLDERDIKITELAYGSEKMTDLFKEMMEKAVIECGFIPENNVPLMIEAIPLDAESVMVIVSKVNNIDEFDIKLNLLPNSKEDRKFIKQPLIDNDYSPIVSNEMSIYNFNSLDNVTEVCKRLRNVYSGINDLYKHKEKYILILNNSNENDDISIQKIDNIVSEYGYKQISTSIAQLHIYEHGEKIIKNKAVQVLADL